MTRHTDAQKAAYIDALFAPEDKALKNIRQQMQADGCEAMSLAPHEGRLLQVLMQLAGVKSVVEIGSLYGYSALWILRALPAGGRLVCLEKQTHHIAQVQKNLQTESLRTETLEDKNQRTESLQAEDLKNKSQQPDDVQANSLQAQSWQTKIKNKQVEFFQGPALGNLHKLKGPFDMVFIDANKSGYKDYLDWAEKHIRPGGLIVGDNVFLFGHLTGKPWDAKVSPNMLSAMKSFNQQLADKNKYISTIIPTGEGLLVAIKR